MTHHGLEALREEVASLPAICRVGGAIPGPATRTEGKGGDCDIWAFCEPRRGDEVGGQGGGNQDSLAEGGTCRVGGVRVGENDGRGEGGGEGEGMGVGNLYLKL